MIKQNAVKFFLEHLKLKDVKVHATCALALARCLQDRTYDFVFYPQDIH